MSKDWYQDVKDWHKEFGVHIGEKPHIPMDKTRVLRMKLVGEEYQEFIRAWARDDLVELADAAADLIYVLNGSMISYGIDLRPIWDIVQESNMKKIGGAVRGDGKILKPLGWKAPDIKNEIERQQNLPQEREVEILELSEDMARPRSVSVGVLKTILQDRDRCHYCLEDTHTGASCPNFKKDKHDISLNFVWDD